MIQRTLSAPPEPTLTLLSFGGGQDSTAILYKLLYDRAFRTTYAPHRLVVAMADTGDEHPETLRHVAQVKRLLADCGEEFVHVTPNLGFHGGNWTGLRQFYRATNTVGSKAYRKTCTWNLKIRPLYGWLEDFLHREYGVASGRKEGFYRFTQRHGAIRVLLGIAAGEETRVRSRAEEPAWMRANIDKRYPLIDLGMDRDACQAYIASVGHKVPPPSNCMLCPFLSEVELVWLYRRHPADYEEWVRLEQAKLAKFAARGVDPAKNFGVWGRKLLPEVLEGALAKYGSWSLEALDDYKMSHGHCVKSSY